MSSGFVAIGCRSRGERLVDLLRNCHERLRRHLGLAVALGSRSDVPASEVIAACARCERYFDVALPLHIEDEEQSIEPRLAGRDARVDEALVVMEREHDEHAPVMDLLAALRSLAEFPADSARRAQVLAVAAPLARSFEDHLRKEEETIFPALDALLSAEEQAAIVRELRARRA